MLSVETVLGLMGLIIITGFFGSFLFEKIRIPDVFLLLAVGILIGQGLTPEARHVVVSFAPYFGSVALIMILFEGGLELDASHLARQFRKAVVLACVCVISSIALIGFAAHAWLGWSWLQSFIFGAVIGSTSSAIVVPIIQRSKAPGDVKVMVSMESVLNDAIAIVVLLILVDIAVGLGPKSATMPLMKIFSGFSISMIVAFTIGLLWLNILEWTKGRPLSYLWSFAMLLLCYVTTNLLQGIGAMAVFFMGILIGNSRLLPKWLVWGKLFVSEDIVDQVAHETLQWFHMELTFLVRSFFFVYMGMLFDFTYLQGHNFWIMLGFTACLAAARCISVWTIQRDPRGPMPRSLLCAYFPRGVVSAVLATLPALHGFDDKGQFMAYTLPIIISTNFIMTVWIFLWEWRHPQAAVSGDPPDESPSGV